MAVLKVEWSWNIGGRESGRKPCSQTPTYDTQATAGILATARIPAATGTPSLGKGHEQEKSQPQQQKCQQQRDLYGKALKIAGKKPEIRLFCIVYVAVTKRLGGLERSASGRGCC